MKIVRKIPLEAPLDKALEALSCEGYNLEREKGRPEVVSTEFHVLEKTAERIVFELRTTEYKRTMTGAIDKGGTAKSVTRSTWNARDRTLTWVYEGGAAPLKMALSGIYRFEAQGDRTTLTHEITVEVKVPLIGEKIAKIAGREFEKSADGYEPILKRYAKELASKSQ
jgi:hypothetical protein